MWSLEQARKLGVDNNTGWRLKHKLMQAVRERDQGRRLAGTVQVDDAHLGGEHADGKGGQDT